MVSDKPARRTVLAVGRELDVQRIGPGGSLVVAAYFDIVIARRDIVLDRKFRPGPESSFVSSTVPLASISVPYVSVEPFEYTRNVPLPVATRNTSRSPPDSSVPSKSAGNAATTVAASGASP